MDFITCVLKPLATFSKTRRAIVRVSQSPSPPPLFSLLSFWNCLIVLFVYFPDSCIPTTAAIGNINFENCQKYQGALGTSDLVTGKVKVLAIHILSYYYKQQLNPPIGTHTEWPERVGKCLMILVMYLTCDMC